MSQKSNAVAIADFITQQLDTLTRWGSDFDVIRQTDHTLELQYKDGTRVVIRISNATVKP